MKIKAYKKDFDYTYTLGVFETIELLKNRPDLVLRVYIKSNSYKNKGIPIIDEICREKHIELIESDNTIQKLSKKDNCFAIAIIKKYEMTLQEGNHVVLVNPGVEVHRETIENELKNEFVFAPVHLSKQSAAAVAVLGSIYFEQGKAESADEHKPIYLRKVKNLDLLHMKS